MPPGTNLGSCQCLVPARSFCLCCAPGCNDVHACAGCVARVNHDIKAGTGINAPRASIVCCSGTTHSWMRGGDSVFVVNVHAGSGVLAKSDAECNRLCVAQSVCTAWVRAPSMHACWMFQQQNPQFSGGARDRHGSPRCDIAPTRAPTTAAPTYKPGAALSPGLWSDARACKVFLWFEWVCVWQVVLLVASAKLDGRVQWGTIVILWSSLIAIWE